MFYLFITIGLCAFYVFLLAFFSLFFKCPLPRRAASKHYTSLLSIIVLSVSSFWVSLSIPDADLSNRTLHALSGGFVATWACYRAWIDTSAKINTLQFFSLAFLLVTALGVANEILELILQLTFNIQFAETRTDTGLDLVSNTLGILAGFLMVVAIKKRQVAKQGTSH